MSKITIKGSVQWANLEVRNEMSDKFQVDLCGLSDKAVEAIEEQGMTVHYKEDDKQKGSFITCKSNRPIPVSDADGAVVDGRVVGNGSLFIATINPYDWQFKGKAGVSPSLSKLIITDLALYDNDGDDAVVNYDEAL